MTFNSKLVKITKILQPCTKGILNLNKRCDVARDEAGSSVPEPTDIANNF